MISDIHIRAVAVDLDDTLLRSDKSISPRTLAAWEECRARGIRLIVATARSERASARFLQQLCPDAAVTNSGGLARVGERAVFSRLLPPDAANGIARACLEAGATMVTAETQAGYFWNSHEPPFSADYGDAVYTDYSLPLPPTYKLTVDMPDAAAVRDIAARFPASALTGYSGETWWRFSPRGVHKLAGLSAVLDAMGIAHGETAAFGDDYSDLELLRGVGYGIAMKNAAPEVLAAAREVTDDNDHDGVARWLEHRLLHPVTVCPAGPAEAQLLYDIQQRAFLPLLERYQDHAISPAAESFEAFCTKLMRPGTTPYLIFVGGEPAGAVRIQTREDGTCRVSALGILPEYQNRGVAQCALRQIEQMHPAAAWVLDTVAQEAGNCHLYEKLGYVRVGAPRPVNRNMSLVDYRKEL